MNPSITRTQSSTAGALAPLPQCTHGIAAWLHAALAALRARLATPREMKRGSEERDALCGLTAHVLRDIGASPSVLAEALACDRHARPADYDRIRY